MPLGSPAIFPPELPFQAFHARKRSLMAALSAARRGSSAVEPDVPGNKFVGAVDLAFDDAVGENAVIRLRISATDLCGADRGRRWSRRVCRRHAIRPTVVSFARV